MLRRHLSLGRPISLSLALLAGACTANPQKAPEDAPIVANQGSKLPPPPSGWEETSTPRAPLSLTASDGTGLKLVSLTARGVVEGPLAFTELHLIFENPEDRQIEGRFEIEMPPHAAISRFAMKIHGAWQEGEVVERQAARAAYEDFLHRKQDPALLENNAGNAFSARVFPIAPRERKELIVSYSQELPRTSEPYRLMLRGLPMLDHLDASVIVRAPQAVAGASNLGGSAVATRVVEVKKDNYMPDRDLEVPSEAGAVGVGLRHQNIALARVVAAGEMPPAAVGSLTVLFDTSASRSLDFARSLRRLDEVVKDLRVRSGEDFALRVIGFDQGSVELFRGKASELRQEHLDEIARRRALGASDLEGALRSLAADPQGASRLLIFSDGIATAGEVELSGMIAATQRLASAGLQRADAVIDGGIQDTSALKAITTAALPKDGVVIDGRLHPQMIAHKLGSATLAPIKVEVPGAAWVWPETIEGAQPGDEALVYADLPAELAMTVRLTGEATIEASIPAQQAERPLLERAWVRARIERMQAERSRLPEGDRDMREAMRRSIIELSTRHRVLSDFTALLVLETEWDYERFKIDRRALAEILSVGPMGVTVDGRQKAPPAPAMVARQEEWRVPEPEIDADATPQGMPGAPSPRAEPMMDTMMLEADSAPATKESASASDEVWGGLTGTEVGEAYGVGGLGLVGTGRGGGGTGEGTIGLGNTGLIGKGGGGGTGSGYGRGAGAGFGGRGKRVPMVRQGKAEVMGGLDKDIIRRIVRAHINEVRFCYNQGLAREPTLRGRVSIRFAIGGTGKVLAAMVAESELKDARVAECIVRAVRRWTFPKPTSAGTVEVTYPFVLETDGVDWVKPEPPTPEELARREAEAAQREAEWKRREAEMALAAAEAARVAAEEARTEGSPYSGKLFDVHAALKRGAKDEAMTMALAWLDASPGDVLALMAVGDAAEASGEHETAARAYGSLIDLFPSRADLRRYAGNRLERLGASGLRLAVDTYQKAAESRPDHPASHRLYAFALVKAGQHRAAWEAIARGVKQVYPSGRFAAADQILREDAGLIAAAWARAEPSRRLEVEGLAKELGVELDREASTRFVITWETDANDVDFHIYDANGGHAYYSDKRLRSGGWLYADVTTGYGPECFTIPGTPAAFPYRLEANYYSRGPMGYGMGKMQVIQHDGKGELRFEERPYLIMKDRAFVSLGTIDKPL
jgi:hypothetical protein